MTKKGSPLLFTRTSKKNLFQSTSFRSSGSIEFAEILGRERHPAFMFGGRRVDFMKVSLLNLSHKKVAEDEGV
ncbi:MAG: hypothetical protein COZ69_12855 [Deltaproteobacteria bacterium CG_4_8_14_3_um_filter_45_9]|nr:MAG: hypothetical protein COS40_08135 [Deltaproteobacteria bacterium CG03_land_8_20_14_0_80_45_14]PIX21796.1 MAG: hypothetical protein COZ69_12855 [Deltaproteobacteria bacterium CG_4_8_14_3_um_filter_45_9]